MGIPVYFGTKLYGWHDNGDGTSTATQFFHIYYIPVFPTGSFIVYSHDPATGSSRVTPRPAHLGSIVGTYFKVWGFIIAVLLALAAGSNLAWPGHMIKGAVQAVFAVGLMLTSIASWFFVGRQPGAPSTPTRYAMMAVCFGLPLILMGWRFTTAVHYGLRSAVRDPFSMIDAKDAASFMTTMLKRDLAEKQAKCDGGDASACYTLADEYERGVEGAMKDTARAASLYGKACDGKNVGACFRAGTLLSDEHDAAGAFAAYAQGCDLGDGASCTNAGVALLGGDGVAKDVPRALALYDKGCDARIGVACNNLGNLWAEGKEVKKDKAKAKAYFKRGCDAGWTSACVNLRRRR